MVRGGMEPAVAALAYWAKALRAFQMGKGVAAEVTEAPVPRHLAGYTVVVAGITRQEAVELLAPEVAAQCASSGVPIVHSRLRSLLRQVQIPRRAFLLSRRHIQVQLHRQYCAAYRLHPSADHLHRERLLRLHLHRQRRHTNHYQRHQPLWQRRIGLG